MKVFNCSTDDYANFAHDNAKALRSAGVFCLDAKTIPHPFKYKSESKIVDLKKIVDFMRYCDVIQIFHSDVTLLNLVKPLNKRVIVHHTGSRYRSNPGHYNNAFNPVVETSVIALCEFSGLGSKNEKYLVGSIDCGNSEVKPTDGNLIVSHYPSNPQIKGTAKVNELISKCDQRFIYNHSIEKVEHQAQFKRMNECDIYVELFQPKLGGREYGSWGITTLEAAALGKIVVTQNLHHDFYLKHYPECPLVIVNTENEFIDRMNWLTSQPADILDDIKRATINWVKNNHSHIATGNKIKTLLNL